MVFTLRLAETVQENKLSSGQRGNSLMSGIERVDLRAECLVGAGEEGVAGEQGEGEGGLGDCPPNSLFLECQCVLDFLSSSHKQMPLRAGWGGA